mmetsp:Transcript_10411/g.21372  ORF Transcript_10411/g.21372 Transcript_10411/m.21372 type:complete len:208 (-) Transcript_10411:133-756(-)
MVVSPFSNSSWHLLSRTRLKLTFLPSFSNSGSWSRRVEQSCAYSSQKVGSERDLSKIWSIRPTRLFSWSNLISTSFKISLSKFCGVSLFSTDMISFCFFSSSGSLDCVWPTTYLFSVLCSFTLPPPPMPCCICQLFPLPWKPRPPCMPGAPPRLPRLPGMRPCRPLMPPWCLPPRCFLSHWSPPSDPCRLCPCMGEPGGPPWWCPLL